MAFTSYDFLLFFLVVFVLYWMIRERRWQNLILLAASSVFYGWLVPWHVAVLFLSIIVDYFLALAMLHWKSRSTALMRFGVILNIGLLTLVKYYFFYNTTLAHWLTQMGLSDSLLPAKIILPLGLSFYILKKISYLIEVGKGTLQPTRDFIAFAAYISFFPQVLSGPIDRPQKFLKQLGEARTWEMSKFHTAWPLILMGFFKKFVVANSVKVIVDQIFVRSEPSKLLLMIGGLAFTLQILADFSSYTDISRGFAFLLGLETTENFNKPYLAFTPNEFWNRWHISFSSWLRDYIFFPIRRTLMRYKVNETLAISIPPLVTMLISGLWHGAGWTFVVWGLYYGMLTVIYQLLGFRGDWKPEVRGKRFFAWLVMFMIIVFGWIIFRASSLSWLWNILLYAPYYGTSQELIAGVILLVTIGFYASFLFIKYFLEEFHPDRINLIAIFYVLITMLTIVYTNSSTPDFIYFQF